MTLRVRSRSVEAPAGDAPQAALLLISARALLDAADVLHCLATTEPIDDYAGRDVLCGLGGMAADEADEMTRAIVRAVLDDVSEHLRARSERDWDQAVGSLGATVRAKRTSIRRVQHRPVRPAA
jgi:hypothetical protein